MVPSKSVSHAGGGPNTIIAAATPAARRTQAVSTHFHGIDASEQAKWPIKSSR
jgi:hypothetical protein